MPKKPAPAPKRVAAKKVPAIYALCCPMTGQVRYIGKAVDPAARLKTHLADSLRRNTPVYCWIRKLLGMGQSPSMVILEAAPHDWREAEVRLIAEYRAKGELLNVADGGDEPYCPTQVRADNGRAVAKIRTSTPYKAKIYELKRRMGALLKEGVVSLAAKEKLRVAARNRPDLFGQWAAL